MTMKREEYETLQTQVFLMASDFERCEDDNCPCPGRVLRHADGSREGRGGANVTTQRAETYGTFPGGDPRRFTPDREACTPEEIARWAAACLEWREGRQEDAGPGCATFGDGSAISGAGFGVGVYDFGEMPDDDAIETIGLLEAENRELRKQLEDAVRIAESVMEENRRLDLDLEKSNDAVMWHLAEQVELEGKLTRQRRRFIWAYWIVALVGVALGVCLTNAAWLLR